MARQTEQPWERQPNESAKAYEAFCIYRDMGPERSIYRVHQEFTKSTPKSERLLKRWSSQWNWVERVRQYENYLDGIETARRRKAHKAARTRRAKYAQTMLDKAMQGLESIDFSQADMRSVRALVEAVRVASDVQELALSPIDEASAELEERKREFDISHAEKVREFDLTRQDRLNAAQSGGQSEEGLAWTEAVLRVGGSDTTKDDSDGEVDE